MTPPAPAGSCAASGNGAVHHGGSSGSDAGPSPLAISTAGDVTEATAEVRRIARAAERAVDRAGDPGSPPD